MKRAVRTFKDPRSSKKDFLRSKEDFLSTTRDISLLVSPLCQRCREAAFKMGDVDSAAKRLFTSLDRDISKANAVLNGETEKLAARFADYEILGQCNDWRLVQSGLLVRTAANLLILAIDKAAISLQDLKETTSFEFLMNFVGKS